MIKISKGNNNKKKSKNDYKNNNSDKTNGNHNQNNPNNQINAQPFTTAQLRAVGSGKLNKTSDNVHGYSKTQYKMLSALALYSAENLKDLYAEKV